MNKTKQLTTKQRVLFYLGIVTVSALVGGVTGALGLGLGDKVLTFNFDIFMIFVYILTAMSILVTLWFMYQANHYQNRYEAMDEDADEDESYEIYRKTFKNLGLASTFYNVSVAFIFFSIGVGICDFHDRISNGLAFKITTYVVEAIFFILLFVLQIMIFKLTQKIRHYKISVFPTIKEVKEFAYSYDEGELQANYEQAFLIVFNLNQYLPFVYVILCVLAIVSSLDVTSGLVVTTGIYIYINLANIRFVNKYFRK
ncbi:DUF3169 family protein [Streptococcus ruminicola]|uniref:DUF3169 family protein n=1 Tax=Streptococcus ruminicola TaxID=2686210 RepID=UPI0012FC58D8|nr:DUF3169 family protein [Streptococcus ruminicola]QGX00327.1 DUF3169 family protein [Streptococcus ruminicola]WFM81178.1 DUF3169 family protein [Streptococcus ruminicola]